MGATASQISIGNAQISINSATSLHEVRRVRSTSATEENKQTTTSLSFSDENMLASIDPTKTQNMSTRDRDVFVIALEFRLLRARGHLRSNFQRITYSDYLNLLKHAYTCLRNSNYVNNNLQWNEVVVELLSIVKEYESATSKHSDSDVVLSQVVEPSFKPKCEADNHNSKGQHFREFIDNFSANSNKQSYPGYAKSRTVEPHNNFREFIDNQNGSVLCYGNESSGVVRDYNFSANSNKQSYPGYAKSCTVKPHNQNGSVLGYGNESPGVVRDYNFSANNNKPSDPGAMSCIVERHNKLDSYSNA